MRTATALILTLALTSLVLAQGPLNPPGAPVPAMKSLQEIWDKLCMLQAQIDALQTASTNQDTVIAGMVTNLDLTLQSSQAANAGIGTANSRLGTLDGQVREINTNVLRQEGKTDQQSSLLSALALGQGVSLPWVRYALDSDPGNDTGAFCSLAFRKGSSLYAVIGYQGGFQGGAKALKRALLSLSGSPWDFTPDLALTINTVASTPLEDQGYYTSVAFFPTGQDFISHTNLTTGTLLLDTETVALIDSPGYTAFAISPTGMQAIVSSSFGSLIYRSRMGLIGSWVDSNVGIGYRPSVRFTPSGPAAISYQGATGLKYAVADGAGWNIATVDTAAASANGSLAIGPDGNPAISYTTTGSNALKYAYYNGANWQIATVDATGAGPEAANSLAFTPGGQPSIAYYDSTAQDLKFAVLVGMTWQIATVDPVGDAGIYCSLAYGPTGQPSIAYQRINEGASKLMYAVKQAYTNP